MSFFVGTEIDVVGGWGESGTLSGVLISKVGVLTVAIIPIFKCFKAKVPPLKYFFEKSGRWSNSTEISI